MAMTRGGVAFRLGPHPPQKRGDGRGTPSPSWPVLLRRRSTIIASGRRSTPGVPGSTPWAPKQGLLARMPRRSAVLSASSPFSRRHHRALRLITGLSASSPGSDPVIHRGTHPVRGEMAGSSPAMTLKRRATASGPLAWRGCGARPGDQSPYAQRAARDGRFEPGHDAESLADHAFRAPPDIFQRPWGQARG